MMKKLYLLLIATALVTASLQAQFKMTAKTHGFRIGDTHNFIFAKGITEGQSGQNVIWDFTALEKVDKTLTSNMLDPNATSSTSKISNSNLILEEFGNQFFFNSANDGMYQNGAIHCNTVTKYDKPFIKLKFPFAYGNKVAGNYSGVQESANFTVKVSGKYEIYADGYGTLLLPNDVSVENALRIKQTRTIEYENSTNPLTEITYRWYSQNVRYPILVIVKYVTENSSYISETAVFSGVGNVQKSALVATAEPSIEAVSSVKVYPNPYDEELKVSYELAKAGKVKIDIFDVSGKLFKSISNSKQDAGQNFITINSSEINMMPGVYYLKITAGDNTYTRKVVKQ